MLSMFCFLEGYSDLIRAVKIATLTYAVSVIISAKKIIQRIAAFTMLLSKRYASRWKVNNITH
jgi:hypothetical protein